MLQNYYLRTLGTLFFGMILISPAAEATAISSSHLDSLVTQGIEMAHDGKPDLAIEAFETVLAAAHTASRILVHPLRFSTPGQDSWGAHRASSVGPLPWIPRT